MRAQLGRLGRIAVVVLVGGALTFAGSEALAARPALGAMDCEFECAFDEANCVACCALFQMNGSCPMGGFGPCMCW